MTIRRNRQAYPRGRRPAEAVCVPAKPLLPRPAGLVTPSRRKEHAPGWGLPTASSPRHLPFWGLCFGRGWEVKGAIQGRSRRLRRTGRRSPGRSRPALDPAPTRNCARRGCGSALPHTPFAARASPGRRRRSCSAFDLSGGGSCRSVLSSGVDRRKSWLCQRRLTLRRERSSAFAPGITRKNASWAVRRD